MGRLILTFVLLTSVTFGIWSAVVGPPHPPWPDYGDCQVWTDDMCEHYAYPKGDGPAYQAALPVWRAKMAQYRARHPAYREP